MRIRLSGGRDPKRTPNRLMQGANGLIALMLLAVVLTFSGRAGATPPGGVVDPKQATGCCVCRGTRGGEQQSIRSCTDGVKVEACVAACHTQGGASIGFGYQQSCSENCAGFPTQH